MGRYACSSVAIFAVAVQELMPGRDIALNVLSLMNVTGSVKRVVLLRNANFLLVIFDLSSQNNKRVWHYEEERLLFSSRINFTRILKQACLSE